MKFPARGKAADGNADDQEEILARWEDPQHRFELVRLSYNSGYRLTGVLKNLEAAVQAANVDAKRLDDAGSTAARSGPNRE